MSDDGDQDTKTQAGSGAPPAWLWGFWTLQNVALAILLGLALAIGVIAIHPIIYPAEAVPQTMQGDAFATPRTLAVLLIAALACAALAWLDQTNVTMLGHGLRHLLTIQKAAVTSFIISGAATIGIAMFVALTALFSGELKRGLYALAAIEFLLKLTAVSAIVVLITLRKPTVRRTTAVQRPADGEEALAGDSMVIEEDEDRGRLEFGSLAFAFSLVVIAGMIVPSEDLMRLASMFFGGEKKVEDYLPRHPLVSVQDDLADQLADAVERSVPMRQTTASLPPSDQSALADAVKVEIENVLNDVIIDGVRQIGAWPLLESICDDRADTMIFSNSDERLLADHLAYLAAEALVEYPYGDINLLVMTRHGHRVVSKYVGHACAGAEMLATGSQPTTADQFTVSPRVNRISISGDEPTISAVGTEPLRITSAGTVYQLELEAGLYQISLNALGRVDPFLQLFDTNGALVEEDDDSGSSGAFNASITIPVTEGQKYFVRAVSYDNRQGDATLEIAPAGVDTVENDTAAIAILEQQPARPLTERVDVPPGGAAFSFRAISSGSHLIQTSLPAGTAITDTDLVAVLFRGDGQAWRQIASDDDGGVQGYPVIFTELAQGEIYILVLRHFASLTSAQAAPVFISVSPAVAAADLGGLPVAGGTQEADTPAPASLTDDDLQAEPPAPAEAPAAKPTGSGGSQSDP